MKKKHHKLLNAVYIICALLFLMFVWEIYIPQDFFQTSEINYAVKKGFGSSDIAKKLKDQGIIKNAWFFTFYALGSGSYGKLQAGNYTLSPSMPIATIVKKFASGDVIQNNITIIEGWDERDVAEYLEGKNITTQKTFLAEIKKDYSADFEFLKSKPKKVDLEGYLFPDTYQLPEGATASTVITNALANFDKKLTPDLRAEIIKQKKTIFQIVTMASLIEKEVVSQEDKKTVSGILWKRLAAGMPLQVDATINYITGKNHPGARLKDTTIDSPYNTYKYYGLPLGPICNPGIESIMAAIYPTKSEYWFYLSASATGETIFSKTLDQHNAAIYKYLR